MGWAHGFVNGRDVGYGVEAPCDYPGCSTNIDRGMGWACGNAHANMLDPGEGCGDYFCTEHIGADDHPLAVASGEPCFSLARHTHADETERGPMSRAHPTREEVMDSLTKTALLDLEQRCAVMRDVSRWPHIRRTIADQNVAVMALLVERHERELTR